MDKLNKQKHFEKMATLLGINRTQFLAIKHFEKFYKTHKNQGFLTVEKNIDIEKAKELFNAWDIDRKGFIHFDVLAENLISIGLAASKDQVLRLLVQVIESDETEEIKRNKKDNFNIVVELKQFMAIFEKDTFSERAIKAIKKNIKDKMIEREKIEA